MQLYGDESLEEGPLTLHIVLPTRNPESIVWITDTLVDVGFDNVASIEKITYLRERKVACSAWGFRALPLRDELAARISSGDVDVSSPGVAPDSLRRFCTDMKVLLGIPSSQPADSVPGVILTTFYDCGPQVYFASCVSPPAAARVENLICIGDQRNAARIFIDHYYQRSGKTMEEALALGIHTMRLAHATKAAYIGPPNAWAYRNGVFAKLTLAEMTKYTETSMSIDLAILNSARES